MTQALVNTACEPPPGCSVKASMPLIDFRYWPVS